jgi:hypothetical protein
MSGGGIFVWVMIGIFAFLVLFVILLGIFYPGTGAEQLKWRPTRSPELEAQNEVDDLAQMFEATNAKRRKRGERELDQHAINARLREDADLRRRMRGDGSADEELAQLREAREFRKRRREARRGPDA